MRVDDIETQPWGGPRPKREPMFNAPWTIVALCVGLIALYELQRLFLSDALTAAYGVSATALMSGRWQTLLTSLFLHGSWPHVLMNAVAALAFGPPVARLMGVNPRGAAAFFGFYLVCGVLAGLGFAGDTTGGEGECGAVRRPHGEAVGAAARAAGRGDGSVG